MSLSVTDEKIIQELNRRWSWVAGWSDESETSAGGLVRFDATFELSAAPAASVVVYCSADTRYKLWVNGVRAAVGPTRGCPQRWYYDPVDIGPHLREGHNSIEIHVLRLFPGRQTGHAFSRTRLPGLTFWGAVRDGHGDDLDISIDSGLWTARTLDISLPFGNKDDFFLHVFERASSSFGAPTELKPYGINTKTGEVPPWDLYPRLIPLPQETRVQALQLMGDDNTLTSFLDGRPSHFTQGTHRLVLRAAEYHTAFVRLHYAPSPGSSVEIKYAEGYESEPKVYPWLRVKGDRLAPGLLLGPHDVIDLSEGEEYEPFWYRAFRFLELTIHAGPGGVTLHDLAISQANYPMNDCATWWSSSAEMNDIWDVSVRTLRNCLFDGVSDCPFYEQLQYAEDTRSSGLFHYAISGDDRLMRQAIVSFAISMTPDGLTQSRYPSHVQQVIPGFSLFWVSQVCDHYQQFPNGAFARRYLPAIMTVLDFFRRHIDERGLVSGISPRYWQFVDWAEPWQGTPTHDGGTPVTGRSSNTYTFASMLLCYTGTHVARLADELGASSLATECTQLCVDLRAAINTNCFDGEYYLDSTIDQPHERSQHCQILAALSGVCDGPRARHVVGESIRSSDFTRCSYVFQHYAFRALSLVGLYDEMWSGAWAPWRRMLANNLSTWEEDPVTQRSDCHAWGCAALYEYVVEILGLQCSAAGWSEVTFAPRPHLVEWVDCRVPLGAVDVARVSWKWVANKCTARLELERGVRVKTSDGQCVVEHGVVQSVDVVFERG